jgi:hypothetical protein
MQMKHSLRRALTLTAVLAVAGVGACTDDAPNQPIDVQSMQVTVGGTLVTARAAGGFTAGVTVSGPDVAISAQFLNSAGQPDPAVDGSRFELSVAGSASGGPLPAGVSFERSNAFAGTLRGLPSGTTTVYLGLFDKNTLTDEFGPFPLVITRP